MTVLINCHWFICQIFYWNYFRFHFVKCEDSDLKKNDLYLSIYLYLSQNECSSVQVLMNHNKRYDCKAKLILNLGYDRSKRDSVAFSLHLCWSSKKVGGTASRLEKWDHPRSTSKAEEDRQHPNMNINNSEVSSSSKNPLYKCFTVE